MYIRKVKVLKKPKFDSEWCALIWMFGVDGVMCVYAVGKLMDMHGEGAGAKVDGTYEPPVQESV